MYRSLTFIFSSKSADCRWDKELYFIPFKSGRLKLRCFTTNTRVIQYSNADYYYINVIFATLIVTLG